MGLPNLRKVIKPYRQHIDNMINNMGKDLTLHFVKKTTTVNDGFNDPVRNKSTRKPNFKSAAGETAPTRVTNTKTIKALIEWDPKDFKDFTGKVNKRDTVIRVKTYLTDVPDLLQCKYVVPNSEHENIHLQQFKLFRAPMPRGLGEDRYAYTYWITSDGNHNI